ncbi:unnamed protein product [Blepharisma stoltei]|uniref:Uncharacterized protein n=1 Tax=Blepharisma stoltei TaxID=1481888 RepID=A0AAU9IBD1_9CILI|nr:unnamed protein product [Blepharisma stoltei]
MQGRPLFQPQLYPETNYNGDFRIGRKLYGINKNQETYNPTHISPERYEKPQAYYKPKTPPAQIQANPEIVPSPSQPPSSKAQDYTKELYELQEKLRQKNEELQLYQRINQSPRPADNKQNSLEIYNRINKGMYDKYQFQEKKKEQVQSLDYQLSQKEKSKQMETVVREQELISRLEDLQRRRAEELQSRIEKYQKAKEYREHLEMQAGIRQHIKQEEIIDMKSNVQMPPEMPPATNYSNNQGQGEGFTNAMSFYDSVTSNGNPMYTKKRPRTIFYNPITGALQDTAPFLFGNGSPSVQIIKRPENPYLPAFKNKARIAVDLADHPAFQQPKYTKSSPKVVASFPITGNANPLIYQSDFKESAAKFFGVEERPMIKNSSEKSLASYGSIVINNR